MASLIVALVVVVIVFGGCCWLDCRNAPHPTDNGPWGQWMRID